MVLKGPTSMLFDEVAAGDRVPGRDVSPACLPGLPVGRGRGLPSGQAMGGVDPVIGWPDLQPVATRPRPAMRKCRRETVMTGGCHPWRGRGIGEMP